jgi:hypothetical protein
MAEFPVALKYPAPRLILTDNSPPQSFQKQITIIKQLGNSPGKLKWGLIVSILI